MHTTPVSFQENVNVHSAECTTNAESESIRGSFSSKAEYDDDDGSGGDGGGGDEEDLMMYDNPGRHPGDHQDQVPQDCQTGKYTEQKEFKQI